MTKIISTLRKEVLYGSLYEYIQIIQTCPQKAQGIGWKWKKRPWNVGKSFKVHDRSRERHSLLRACFQRTLNYSHNKQQRYVSGKSQKTLNFWFTQKSHLKAFIFEEWLGCYFSSVCEKYQRAITLLVSQELWLPFSGNECKRKKNGRCGTVSGGSHTEAATQWKLHFRQKEEGSSAVSHEPTTVGNSANYWIE